MIFMNGVCQSIFLIHGLFLEPLVITMQQMIMNKENKMMHKHTAAPWEFESSTGYIKNNQGDIIGDVSTSENIGYSTARANGILQAAAPELLSRLANIISAYYGEGLTEQHIKEAITVVLKLEKETK